MLFLLIKRYVNIKLYIDTTKFIFQYFYKMFVPSPKYLIKYNATDITADISTMVEAVVFTDNLEGKTDELDIILDNSDGRWTRDWYPAKGDKIEISIGYDDNLLNCGTFSVDELNVSYSPDTLAIKARAAGGNSPLRTKKTKASENVTIKQIAQQVADANGLTINDGTTTTKRVQIDWKAERTELTASAAAINAAIASLSVQVAIDGALAHYSPLLAAAQSLAQKGRTNDANEIRQTVDLWYRAWFARAYPELQQAVQIGQSFANRLTAIAATLEDVDKTVTRSKLDIQIERSTQSNETDLAYLARIARGYGVVFSVRDSVITFTSRYDLEAAAPAGAILRADLVSANFTDKPVAYTRARVRWHNPETGKTVVSEISGGDLGFDDSTPSDTLEIFERAETQSQADEIAKSALWRSMSTELEGNLTLPGSTTLMAGVNVTLGDDFGVFSGKWFIHSSTHRLSKADGYLTDLVIGRGRLKK